MGAEAGAIEGRLSISLMLQAGRVSEVSITSSRPLKMPRIFCGKSVAHLLDTLPLLYSVCGTAQACAAVQACEQAQGLSVTPACHRGRELLVHFETAKEHVWRIFQDWPRLLGKEAEIPVIAQVMALMGRFRQSLYPGGRTLTPGLGPDDVGLAGAEEVVIELRALLEMALFPQGLGQWLRIDSEGSLRDWSRREQNPVTALLRHVQAQGWEALGANDIPALPVLEPRALDAALSTAQADQMIAEPLWQGRACETTPYARVVNHPLVECLVAKYGNGLYPRLVARLVELAQIPERLLGLIRQIRDGDCGAVGGASLGAGVGLAQVEAARGRLVHRVELEGERVKRYQILAPTEWNFHPQGVLAQALKEVPASAVDELREQAALLVNAIDPCVAYDLDVQSRSGLC